MMSDTIWHNFESAVTSNEDSLLLSTFIIQYSDYPLVDEIKNIFGVELTHTMAKDVLSLIPSEEHGGICVYCWAQKFVYRTVNYCGDHMVEWIPRWPSVNISIHQKQM